MTLCSLTRRTAALLLLSASLPALADQAGALDPTFDGDGKQTLAFDLGPIESEHATDDTASVVVAAPGGRFYLAGAVATGPMSSAIGLARIRYDGALDPAFGEQGLRVHDLIPDSRIIVHDATLQADGKFLIVGSIKTGIDVDAHPMVCRFTPDGARDASFGDAASTGCRFLMPAGWFNTIVVQGDGRVVLGGTDKTYGFLMRLLPDGSTDATFGTAGTVLVDEDYVNSLIFGVTQTSDGHLLATGFATTAANPQSASNTLVMRLDAASGMPDPTFGPNGIRVVGVDAGSTYYRRFDAGLAVHPYPDGSVLVIGSATTDYSPGPDAAFSQRPFALKLLANGELDPEFGGGIRVYNPCPVFLFDCDLELGLGGSSSFVLGDGRFVIAGAYRYSKESGDLFAMRLLPDGDLDLSFGSQDIGKESTSLVDFAMVEPDKSLDAANAAVADGERILLAGFASTPPLGNGPGPDLDFAIARLDHGLDQIFFEVSSESFGNGTLSPAEQLSVNHSDHVDFDLTPAPGYRIGKVEGCDGALYGKVYTTGPIVADCTVTATFEIKPVALFSDQFEQ